jgi:hypothetical protein
MSIRFVEDVHRTTFTIMAHPASNLRRFMARYFHERPLDRRHKAAGFMTHVLIHPETLEDIEKELTSDSFVKPLREDAR